MRVRSRHTRTAGAVVATLTLCCVAGVASAHGAIGDTVETPIPLWLLYAGSGATVAVTAGWLAVGDRPIAVGRRSVPLPFWLVQMGHNVTRAVGLLALVAVLVVGLTGTPTAAENVATVLFWPVWLKGVGLVAVVAGSPWRILSPWGTLYAGLAWLEGEPPAVFGSYPERLGTWPAVVGFVAVVGIGENLTTVPQSPRLTASLVAAYALVMVGGALAYGPTWLRRADALAVLYGLLGRVAPLSVTAQDERYYLTVRSPWDACTASVLGRSTVAFVVLALYTVSFDGFVETTLFQTLLSTVPASVGLTAVAAYFGGFVLFLGCYWLAVALVDRAGDARHYTGTATAFAATLVPIAAAYEVAHTYPFVLRNLGTLLELVTAGVVAPVPAAGLSLALFWGSQVVLVVVGHLVAVVAAHSVAVSRYGAAGPRAHLPLVVVMVGYTVLSLWIVSQPVAA